MTEIWRAESEADVAAVRELWSEYWKGLGLPLEFQGFGEQLKNLPGEFSGPHGLLLLASRDSAVAGTIALRGLNERDCEVKRLYVRNEFRGFGIGNALLGKLMENAREMGYAYLYADTLPNMQKAIRLYKDAGFENVGPYSADPTPGAIYLRLTL